MKLMEKEPVISIDHNTDVEVIVVTERINKKRMNPVLQMKMMGDADKDHVIIRLHRLKKLKKSGKEHILNMIRECYASRKKVFVSEASKEITSELGHDGIHYYQDFETAYEAAEVGSSA